MPEGKAVFVGDRRGLVVWVVDDAWFEGIDKKGGIFPYLCQIKGDVQARAMTFNEVTDSLNAGLASATRQGLGQEFIRGDVACLRAILIECSAARVCAAFCNFEYFQTHFSAVNRYNQAVLLDVNYTLAPVNSHNKDGYGIYLLHALLNGMRCRSNTFFFTSRASDTWNFIWSQQGSSWWPLRFVPVVAKWGAPDARAGDNTLKEIIRSFLTFLKQGANTDILTTFAEYLVSANRPGQPGFAHPQTVTDIPDQHPFKSVLDGLVTEDKRKRESWKALFYRDPNGTSPSTPLPQVAEAERGTRWMDTAVLKYLIEAAGFGLNITNVGEPRVQLPVQPGMLFVLNLVSFLRLGELNPGGTIDFSIRETGGKRSVQVVVPLLTSERLKNAFYGRDRALGTCAIALHRLLTCSTEIIREQHLGEEGEKLAAEWSNHDRYLAPESGQARSIPRLRMEHCFHESGLHLLWHCGGGIGDAE